MCALIDLLCPFGQCAGNTNHKDIWIGGGIGITPFIAGMKHLAQERHVHPDQPHPAIELFHTTADYDETAFAKPSADADAASIRLDVLVDARDGLLTGERIRAAVPNGESQPLVLWPGRLRGGPASGFCCAGLPVAERFHQDLLAMK